MLRPEPAEIDPATYKSHLEIRIDWSELDVFGHVNNVMFMKYIQSSRVHLWELVGLGDRVSLSGFGPMLASTSCQFLRPLFYPGNVVVRAKVSFIKNTSFGIDHIILNDKGDTVATASDVVVNFDFDKGEKRLLSDALRTQLSNLQ